MEHVFKFSSIFRGVRINCCLEDNQVMRDMGKLVRAPRNMNIQKKKVYLKNEADVLCLLPEGRRRTKN